MAQITVTINGRSFRMACDDGEEERLMRLARRFDGTIDTLRGSFGEIGDLRLTVMAGIMVTDELAETERKIKALQAEVEALRQTRSAVLESVERDQQKVVDGIENTAKRIEALADKLASSLRAREE